MILPQKDLFVDEAAAATEPQLIIPFHLRPSRLLMVGDPKQLPATIISQRASKLGLDRSLLDRLMHDFNSNHIMLDVQYRMKPSISMFPNYQFYENKLRDGENVKCSSYMGEFSVFVDKSHLWLDVIGEEQRHFSGSYYNIDEARTVVEIVQRIQCASCKKITGQCWFSPQKVRIITFYQGQVVYIQNMLRKLGLGQVLVATVDSSQGCEADIVIVSFVRSNRRNSGAGFLDDDRRICVALTRAKYQLICVGNTSHLSFCGASTLKAMIKDANMRNIVQYHELLSNGSAQSGHNKISAVPQNQSGIEQRKRERSEQSAVSRQVSIGNTNEDKNPGTRPTTGFIRSSKFMDDSGYTISPPIADVQPKGQDSAHQAPRCDEQVTHFNTRERNIFQKSQSKKDVKYVSATKGKVRRLKLLKQKLPFVQTNLREKKIISIQISKLERELLTESNVK